MSKKSLAIAYAMKKKKKKEEKHGPKYDRKVGDEGPDGLVTLKAPKEDVWAKLVGDDDYKWHPKSQIGSKIPKKANGGPVKKPESELDEEAMKPLVQSDENAKMMADSFGPKKKKYAEGGDVSAAQAISDSFAGALGSHAKGGEISDDDLVMRIMKKKYSKGGQVANDTGTGQEADKLPNQFDDLVLRDDMEFNYTGANSGDELGNKEENERREDIVSRIMNSRKKKDKNPNPA